MNPAEPYIDATIECFHGSNEPPVAIHLAIGDSVTCPVCGTTFTADAEGVRIMTSSDHLPVDHSHLSP